MEESVRSVVAQKCIVIEFGKDLNENDALKHFQDAVKFSSVTKTTFLEEDDLVKYILLFSSDDDADKYVKKKRITGENGLDIMIHNCSQPCYIPQEWLQIAEYAGQSEIPDSIETPDLPPGYNDIFPQEKMPMPGPSHQQQPISYPGQQIGPNMFPQYGPYPPHGYPHQFGMGGYPPYPYNFPPQPEPTVDKSSSQEIRRPVSLDRSKEQNMNRKPKGQNNSEGQQPVQPGFYGQNQGYYRPQLPEDSAKGNLPDIPGQGGFQYGHPGYYPMVYPGYEYAFPPNHQGLQHYPSYGEYYNQVGPNQTGAGQDRLPNQPDFPQSGHSETTNVKRLAENSSSSKNIPVDPNTSFDSSLDSNSEPIKKSRSGSLEATPMESEMSQWTSMQETHNTKDTQEEKKESIKMIKVSNIPPGSSRDSIQFFFENKRKSGGGDIEDLDYDEDSHTAIITFEEEDVAERVINKKPILFEKKIVEVEIFKPETTEEEEDMQSTGNQSDEENQTQFAIEVRGFKTTTSKDTIMYYFEGRKGANSDVEKMEFLEEKEMYMLWFNEKDAVDVVLRKTHIIEGRTLAVKRYSPPPPPKPVPKYDDKIYITGINPKTTKDGLENFLSAKSKVEPTEIIFGEADGTALVTFEEPPDIEKLVSVCTKRQLDSSYLKIHRVDITDCVVVSGFRDTTTSDTLEFYFDNKKRSGVDGVREIKLNKGDNQCLIYFEDPESALKVCEKRHVIEGQELHVQVYYGCLGQAALDEDGPKFKPLKPIIIKDLNAQVIEFLLNSETNKKALDMQLLRHHGVVNWPDVKERTDILEVTCTLTEEVSDCRKLAKTWEKTMVTEVEKFLSMLQVIDFEILQEMWEDVMKPVRGINITNTESVAVKVNKSENKITVVGHKMPAEDVGTKIQKIIEDVSFENDRKKIEVTEEVGLKHFQILILLYLHFLDKMRSEFEGLDIHPNIKKGCLIFKGMTGHISAAKVKMYEQLQPVVESSIGQLSDGYIQYLKTPEVKTFLGQQLKQSNVLGVWEVRHDNVLFMHSLSDEGVVTAIGVLKESVKEAPITLDQKEAALVQTDVWTHEVKAIEMEFSKAYVKIIIRDPKTVAIYFTSEVDEGILLEKVRDIFYKHATTEKQLKVPHAEMRLLQEQYKQEIAGLQDELKKQHVTLSTNNFGVNIQGNAKGVEQGKEKVDDLVKSIYKKKHTLTKAGIVKHMTSDQGKSKLYQVEKTNKVVIEIDKNDGNDEEEEVLTPSGGMALTTEKAFCTTPTGQTIKVLVGDMTDLKIDILVNAANKELQHIGGLAKVIVQKGGKSIQTECDNYVRTKNKNMKMYEGEIFCSSPGNLPCKMIAHAVGPVWKGGRNGEEDYLCECVQAPLERAEDKKYKSIAIPAISTGVFGYPANKATQVIVEAIRDYFKANPFSSLNEIYLCDLKDDNAELFVKALEKYFDNVQKPRGRPGQMDSGRIKYKSPAKEKEGFVHVNKADLFSHISVSLVKGQIARQEVDVLVNTTSTSLQLNQGAVSQSLLKVGGQELQQECQQKYPNGIQVGEVAKTSGAKLECKMVCHGALPGWNGGTALKIMETFMNNCLKAASDNGYVSIAFPALGTGNLGYPKNTVARNMFSCVDKFSSSNPGSSVCDVRFVVYERDIPTIKTFEEEQRKRQSGESMSRQARKLSEDTSGSGNIASASWQQEALGGNKQASVDIGNVTLKVYQGDITEANVDVIVNGTNRQLDLTRGGVAQAILKKGGKELSKNLQLPSVQKEMKRDGMTVTHAGSGFNSEYIVHVDMEENHPDLKAKFREVLEKVADLDQETVALPALGAGMSCSIDSVASSLFEALLSFVKKDTEVTEVHVVIFQDSMLSQFLSAMENCLQQSDAHSQGFLSKLKGWIGYGNKNQVKSSKQWIVSKKPKSSINLTVYAKDHNSADHALLTLEENMIRDYREKMIEDASVKDLSKDQIATIKKLEDKWEVEIDVNTRIGRIKINGLPDNLSDAVGEVHTIIRDLERQKQKKQQAEWIKDMVQWYFISVENDGQKLEEYPPEVNLILEQALKNNDQQAFFLDNSGNKYIVDFNTYEEYPEDDPNDTVSVLRKSKLTDSALDLPSNWATMAADENIKIVIVQPSEQEYQTVSQDFNTNMAGNYSTLIKIEKIQNITLLQQYNAKKKLMDSTNPKGTNNELKLWHGTAMEAVDSINTYGFNRSYCGKNAVAFGNGVYFAVNPTYSAQAQYARPDPTGQKRMYMCKVLVGEYIKGQHGMKVPPAKPGAAGSHILYDSVVDNPAVPGIFVIFHDTQAYPEYLITFK